MRFAINKYVQLGLWCAISSAALAAPLPSDPVFIESEGCVQSPLPHAPKEAMKMSYGGGVYEDRVIVWFQPCTVPTLSRRSVLLMELQEWRAHTNITAELPTKFPNMAADYFNLLENSQKMGMAFFSSTGRVLAGDQLMSISGMLGTFLVKKETGKTTSNLDSSLVKLVKPDNFVDGGVVNGEPAPTWDFTIPTTSGLDSPIPLDNYTGPWWNTEEGGHGLVVSQDSANYLWLTWYSYDDQSEPLWYVSESTNIWTSPNKIEGALLRTRYNGSNALTGAFDAKQVTQEKIGTFSLTFNGVNNADFSYTINGKTSTKQITRFKLH